MPQRVRQKSTPTPAPKNRFYDVGDAKDGKELVKQLELLGMIGTRRSLQAACNYARSPLKTYLPDHWERSVRLDALQLWRIIFQTSACWLISII